MGYVNVKPSIRSGRAVRGYVRSKYELNTLGTGSRVSRPFNETRTISRMRKGDLASQRTLRTDRQIAWHPLYGSPQDRYRTIMSTRFVGGRVSRHTYTPTEASRRRFDRLFNRTSGSGGRARMHQSFGLSSPGGKQ